jgi:hypothetical protein
MYSNLQKNLYTEQLVCSKKGEVEMDEEEEEEEEKDLVQEENVV